MPRVAATLKETPGPARIPIETSCAQIPSFGASRSRVLVVDDHKDGADFLAMFLRYLGHEAIALAEKYRPHICFMDVCMPAMDGLTAARALQASPWGAALELIAVTALSSPLDCERIRGAGFRRQLVKPIDLEEVSRLIGELNPSPSLA